MKIEINEFANLATKKGRVGLWEEKGDLAPEHK